MYHPYLRGKQNELLVIRENAKLLSDAGFTPIVEPVKGSLTGLQKTLNEIVACDGNVAIVVNPQHGALNQNGDSITKLLTENFTGHDRIIAAVLATNTSSITDVVDNCQRHSNHPLALIHIDFPDAKNLAVALGSKVESMKHVFFDSGTTKAKLYQKYFKGSPPVLIRDGFEKRPNREYPPVEFFSELHETYELEGMQGGFGDFAIVGDDYSESGGPAYAVTIHLTFIDPDKDNAMFIHHFVSKDHDSPRDPAGKFIQALNKLINEIDKPNSPVFASDAIRQFRELHDRRHYPGLGYLKKLSIQHHFETLAHHLSN